MVKYDEVLLKHPPSKGPWVRWRSPHHMNNLDKQDASWSSLPWSLWWHKHVLLQIFTPKKHFTATSATMELWTLLTPASHLSVYNCTLDIEKKAWTIIKVSFISSSRSHIIPTHSVKKTSRDQRLFETTSPLLSLSVGWRFLCSWHLWRDHLGGAPKSTISVVRVCVVQKLCRSIFCLTWFTVIVLKHGFNICVLLR